MSEAYPAHDRHDAVVLHEETRHGGQEEEEHEEHDRNRQVDSGEGHGAKAFIVGHHDAVIVQGETGHREQEEHDRNRQLDSGEGHSAKTFIVGHYDAVIVQEVRGHREQEHEERLNRNRANFPPR